MSQQAQLTELAKDLRIIKTWWPVMAGLCAVIMFFMGIQSLYDNKIAKKEDITALSTKITELTTKVDNLGVKFSSFQLNADIEHQRLKHTSDSLILVLRRRRGVQFVTEIKKHGANGPVALVPINN